MSSENFEGADFAASGNRSPPLISRVQINDILRNLNIREGLMSEEDLMLLENGYSVSESDNDNDGALSVISGSQMDKSLQSPDIIGGIEMNKYLGKVQSSMIPPHQHTSQFKNDYPNEVEEQRIRHLQEKSLIQATLANERAKYIQKQTKLEKMLEQLRNEKKQLQLTMETQKQNFAYQLIQQKQQTQQQMSQIKESQSKLLDQVPQFKEKIDAYKREMMRDGTFIISEESYVEIKAKNDNERSLKEEVQLKIYEAMSKQQREIELLRRENEDLAKEMSELRIKADRDSREMQSMKRLHKEREDESRRKMDELDLRNTKLDTELKRVSQQYKVLLEKGVNQKELDERNRQLEGENRMLQLQLTKLQDSKIDSDKSSDHIRRQLDLVNADKNFLSKENLILEERVKRLEEKLDRNEEELLESKKQAQKYMDRVLNTNDEVKNKFEFQYQKEIQDLKERHTKEMELSKQNLIEVYEKKIEYLNERKDESERRVLKLEQDYKDKSKSYEEILFEFRQLQRQGDEELGHLRLGVKSKSDELMRVTHLYEDNMMLVKELKLENETYKQKIDVLKQEYYKVESMGRQNNADIKAELAVCKERLANYELIEKELDQAIMNVAQSDHLDGGEGPLSDIGNALIQTITSAPTTSKRRIQQSLLLANRLQQKQKEVEALLEEIKQLKDKIDSLEGESKLHKRMLDKTNQPYQYMIADIEKSEKELAFAHKKIKQLEEGIRKMKQENDSLKLQKKGLNDDLQKLLQRRQDIELLQTTLQGIIQHSSAKKIDVDELKHKLAESLRGGKSKQYGQMKSESFKGSGSSPFKQNNREKDILRQLSRSKSRSPRHGAGFFEEPAEKDTMKMIYNKDLHYHGSGGADEQNPPAWYKTLKRQLGK